MDGLARDRGSAAVSGGIERTADRRAGVTSARASLIDKRATAGGGFDAGEWLVLCSSIIKKAGAKRDVTPATIMAVGAVLLCEACSSGDGKASVTLQGIADRARCSSEMARKAIRRLETAGLVDTLHVVGRAASGEARRSASAYLLTRPAKAPRRAPARGTRE